MFEYKYALMLDHCNTIYQATCFLDGRYRRITGPLSWGQWLTHPLATLDDGQGFYLSEIGRHIKLRPNRFILYSPGAYVWTEPQR